MYLKDFPGIMFSILKGKGKKIGLNTHDKLVRSVYGALITTGTYIVNKLHFTKF